MSADEPNLIDKLAAASTTEELRAAHRAVTRAIRTKRRADGRTWGALAQTFVAAMEQWDRENAEDVSVEDRAKHLEPVWRAAWPKGRTWIYNCTRCNDTGWAENVCRRGERCNGDATRIDYPKQEPGKYPRLCSIHADSDYTHDYVTPCFCAKGDGFRRAMQPKVAQSEEFKDAVKSKKRGFSRIGRSE